MATLVTASNDAIGTRVTIEVGFNGIITGFSNFHITKRKSNRHFDNLFSCYGKFIQCKLPFF